MMLRPEPTKPPARVSRQLLLRQEEQPKPIREIAWKAQLRLCARYRPAHAAGGGVIERAA